MSVVPLGPWPEGLDNVHKSTASVFQRRKGGTPRLTVAQNVDLDDDGWPTQRRGTTSVLAGTDFLSAFPFGDFILVQDQGAIIKVDPNDWTTSTLVSGLSTSLKVFFHEINGDVYWTNSVVYGKITAAGAASHWGLLQAPTPTLGTTSGSLPAGRYRVAVTYVDSAGLESGARESQAITLSATGGITVNLTVGDTNAAYVNIYATSANQDKPVWNQKVAVGSLPATISTDRLGKRQVKTHFLRGPLAATGIASYKGYTFLWKDNWVFRSRGQVPHLFYPRNEFMNFSETVRYVVPLQTGFYVATTDRLVWVTGGNPKKWQKTTVDFGTYAAAGLVISGAKIPVLKTTDPVALFVSEDGLVAGTPDGNAHRLTDSKLALGTSASTADLVYHEHEDLRQILMLLP